MSPLVTFLPFTTGLLWQNPEDRLSSKAFWWSTLQAMERRRVKGPTCARPAYPDLLYESLNLLLREGFSANECLNALPYSTG
jgi:hypothetical protein